MEANTKSYVKSMDHEFLDAVKPLMRRVKVACTKNQRLQSIRELQVYLFGWIRVLEYSQRKLAKPSHPKSTSFLSSLLRSINAAITVPPPCPQAIALNLEERKKKSVAGINDSDDFSLIGSVYSSRATSEVDEEDSETSVKSMKMASAKSVSMQGYECDYPSMTAVSFESSLDDDMDVYGQNDEASLRLMTCGSLDNADAQLSVVAMSTNIIGYDSKKTYDSYGFQSVDAAKAFDGYAQLENETDTAYSAAAVSSDQASNNHNNNEEDEGGESRMVPDFVDNRAAMMKSVMDQVIALFGGLGDDMGVEIMEVMPGGSQDITATTDAPRSRSHVTAAGGNDRDEVESLRSARSGHVRKMVNTFDGSKH